MKIKLKSIITNLIGDTIEVNGEIKKVNKYLFLMACSTGDLELVKKLTSNKYKNFIDREVVLSSINKDKDKIYVEGFRQAAYSGKYDVFEFLIEKYTKEIRSYKKNSEGIDQHLVSLFTNENIDAQDKMIDKLLKKGFEIPPQILSYAFINEEVNEKLIDLLYEKWMKEDANFNSSSVLIREVLKVLEDDRLEIFDFLSRHKIINNYGKREFKIIMNEIDYLNIRVGFDEYKEKIRGLIKKELHHKKLIDEMKFLNVNSLQKSKKKI